MSDKINIPSLVWVKDVCDEHKKPNVVAFLCGSVVEWNCKKCGKPQTSNPHYVKHNDGVCERCQFR